ncbi:hypothetical protein PFISCL1PPCAC_261, partial [Pristionchus fissidentatus]
VTACDTTTGKFNNVTGEVYCQKMCDPTTVKCAEDKLCPNITAFNITCPSQVLNLGRGGSIKYASCDLSTGRYSTDEVVYCAIADLEYESTSEK